MSRSVLAGAVLGFLVAAGPATAGQSVGAGQARSNQKVVEGTVVDVQTVTIEGNGKLGGVAGAALGGAAASGIGRGAGRRTATVGGAIVGAKVGSRIQKRRSTREGLEVLVKLENGETVAVIQEADVAVAPGDPVLLLVGSDGTTRIRPAPTAGEGDGKP